MSFYEELVLKTQTNYSRYYNLYAAGKTPYELSHRPDLPYPEQIARLVQEIREADCILVGGASGLSAAGGGDFYYEDNPSYRKYFGKYAEKYHFKGAFAGMMHPWSSREEFWGYLATFLHTTQTAPIRKPYRWRKSRETTGFFNVLPVAPTIPGMRWHPLQRWSRPWESRRRFPQN